MGVDTPITIEEKSSGTTGADTLIALTNNQNESGLYTITHPKDTTLQIGNDKDITEYRYRGANPKNYVTFNNEVWRILGVFPTDDGTGKIENRIKIVRNESVGKKYWDTSGSNSWARSSSLNLELNGTYYNSLDSISKSMIENTKYYLGGYKTDEIQKDIMYQYERKISGSGTYYYSSNPNSWVGKIALMYASDYEYAASNECTLPLYGYDNTTCKTNNWLFNNDYQWLLPQFAKSSDNVFIVYSNGRIFAGIVSYNQYGVRPVLYLKSNVKITGGSGTSSDPYILGI